MEKQYKGIRKPITKEKIFKIMITTTFVVAAVFLLKNIIDGNMPSTIAIGITLLVFSTVLLLMRRLKVAAPRQQFVAAIALAFVIFVISLFSGDSYSDDFLLYMAVIGATGMYLRPRYTIVQTFLCTALLIVQYMLYPEKGGRLGQYVLCLLIFVLAGIVFYLAIGRGRVYIEISRMREQEAKELLETMQQIAEELEKNFESSSLGLNNMRDVSGRLKEHAGELRQGSNSIAHGAREVSDTCEDVRGKIQDTEQQVGALTEGIQRVEEALALNGRNMDEMNQQMKTVQLTTRETNEVFQMLGQQMQEIVAATEQLASISSSTTMLALNASIEAARAGKSGAGFAVVASKVQELAVDSSKCSVAVAGVVQQMQQRIQQTTVRLEESGAAINESLDTLQGLRSGFEQLTEQFGCLYQNIEAQNENVSVVDNIFEQLKGQIAEMSRFSEENQSGVDAIAEALNAYKESMVQMLDDTKQVQELSADMLEIVRKDAAAS